MAWLEQDPSGRYHVGFRLGTAKFKRSLKTSEQQEAKSLALRLEENIRLVERGRLVVPEDADVAAFLLSDGKLNSRPKPSKSIWLKDVFDEYFATLHGGAVEASTLYGMEIHARHLRRFLGDRYRFQSLNLDDLQDYVQVRGRDQGRRGRKITPATIKKEIVTLRALWRWAGRRGLVSRAFPIDGLRFPKTAEKPSFQTWAEIERKIKRGGLTNAEQADLWDCLFLTLPEIVELLAFVKKHARQSFIYPMFAFAAHTGARRSEIIRSTLDDIDFVGNSATIHEKKRVRGKLTTRRVPLSPFLKQVLKDWIAVHPGGQHTFCHDRNLDGCEEGRIAPVTGYQSHDHFKRTLEGSKWEKLRGWHVFRHSFCSNCAAAGVDQRLINGWVGHQTEEMVRRYRHLLPDQQQSAIVLVFGNGEQPRVPEAG